MDSNDSVSTRLASIAFLILASAMAAQPASGQQLSQLRAGMSVELLKRDSIVRQVNAAPRTTYWMEGGVVTGLAAIIAVNALARSDAGIVAHVLGSAAAGVVFAVPGMVIGGLFPKNAKPAAVDTSSAQGGGR